MTQRKNETALVTGSSTGIGKVYAERLAARGYDLVVIARDSARLNALADQLKSAHGVHVDVLTADLADRTQLARVEHRLATDRAITMLVNNAASSQNKTFAESTADEVEKMITLNITAYARLASAAVANFMTKKSGTLINIGSGVVMMPDKYNATYGGSKAFVLAFTRNLAAELEPQGLRVQAVLPGAVLTEVWERSGTDINSLPKDTIMSAEDLVDASLAGLDQKEVVTFPSVQDLTSWERMEEARLSLLQQVFKSEPASRYRIRQS